MFSIGYFCESVNALRCSEMIRENVRVGIYSMIAKEIMPKCVKKSSLCWARILKGLIIGRVLGKLKNL